MNNMMVILPCLNLHNNLLKTTESRRSNKKPEKERFRSKYIEELLLF